MELIVKMIWIVIVLNLATLLMLMFRDELKAKENCNPDINIEHG